MTLNLSKVISHLVFMFLAIDYVQCEVEFGDRRKKLGSVMHGHTNSKIHSI